MTAEPPRIVPDACPQDRLVSPGFLGLLVTQLLTAVNDNLFRWLVVGVCKDYPVDIGLVLMAGTSLFVAPYLVLAAPAGFLADRFSKRSVIVGCKVAEVVIMALGIAAVVLGNIPLLFIVVTLTGAQSALFSPAKLGCIPEILPPAKISIANGLFGLTTVAATVVGMAAGGWLCDQTGYRGQQDWWISAVAVLGIAVVGLGCSLLIPRMPAANPHRAFPWNFLAQSWRDIRQLSSSRAMLRVVFGMVFFWSLGALAQSNIDQFTMESGGFAESDRTPLLFALVAGVGVGSILAGVWSAGRVELGILPLGAFGVVVSSLLLFSVDTKLFTDQHALTGEYIWACFLLMLLGISAGLFNVPLESYMQHRSPADSRGAILSAANLMTFAGVMVASAMFFVMRMPVGEGDYQSIPGLVRGGPFTPQQQREVEQTLDELRDKQAVEQVAARIQACPEPLRKEVAGRLLWEQLQSSPDEADLDLNALRMELGSRYGTLFAVVQRESRGSPWLTSRQIFGVFGLGSIPVFFYILCVIPQASIRFLVWLASRTIYRIKVHGLDNLPREGGAMLVANHVSWLDGVLIMLISSRPVRMMVYSGNFEGRIMKWLGNMWGVILLTSNPKQIARALKEARTAVENGELVCIFPEGGISRTGDLQEFKPGVVKILRDSEKPIVPIYLDELWGSIFSYERGRFFWKIPKKIPYPVSIYVGTPVPGPHTLESVRQSVVELGETAVSHRQMSTENPVIRMVRQCKQRAKVKKISDSVGDKLTGGELLTRALILRRLLRKHVLSEDEKFVGVLLPPAVGPVVVNAALTMDRRVAVNLNYTASSEIINACADVAGIKQILTSRKMMEKVKLDLKVKVVYLEDLREKLSVIDKLAGALLAKRSADALVKLLKLESIQSDDVMTLIFTSGSTGVPKGVMLTYGNILSNIKAIDQAVHLRHEDTIIGILPFFHSFGYTVTLWTVLSLDVAGVYHFSPLEAKQIGKICEREQATILLGTPTFLRSYLKRCTRDQFQSLDVVVAGAEKLPGSLADAFEAKFGVRPAEGYGATETSPLVSVNIPASRSTSPDKADAREGSVGQAVSEVTVKAVDPETFEDVEPGKPGMLLVHGPNVMKGYYGRPELTEAAIRDGWYVTGDIGLVDADGFIWITGRESRFSKIGGEMVPHIPIEDALNELIGQDEEEGPAAVVSSVPDDRKGERLVVLHTKIHQSPDELRKGLAERFPPLYVPSADSFKEVAEIPILGTGKLDLKGMKQVALQHFAPDHA